MKKTNAKTTKKNETAGPPELRKLLEVPTPPKASKKKTSPTVASKAEPVATTSDAVPDWAKRAAARDTAAEMVTVPEVATALESTPEPLAPKKGRAPKAATPAPKKAAAKTTDAAPGSLRAIGNGWIESLRAAGHTPSTVSSYGNDLEIAYEFLDGNTAAAEISEKQIAAFNMSRGVLKTRTGKPKAQPTILKTRRALRLALVWEAQQKLIAKAPIPAA